MADEEKMLPPSYTTIAGAWVLDLGRSDTMGRYLRCLGTPEDIIEEQVAREQATESRNAILLNQLILVVYKHTAITKFTQTYVFDEELVTRSRLGERRSTARLGDNVQLDSYVITSNFGSPAGEALVSESRKLVEEGLAHVQEITVRNLTTGERNVTRRVWMRVPMTDVDRDHLRGE